MDLTGRTIRHYRVHEEISRGGMGVVYRATDTRLNRDVALKVLPDDLTHDADRRRRFLQEAQAASALEHPHIAVIHEADEADGVAYIAMELIRGEKLSDLLARQRPAPARALELAAEVAAGLVRAHEKGIIHRDLKPANVMVTDEGHAKIIDFGIAKLIEASAIAGAPTVTGHDTGVGVVLGTMTYMSPEQARADQLDQRSDIFSFGILLHEMLAGQPPFRGKTGIETASAILHEPAPRLPAFGPSVISEAGADIQRIVDKCLAKDPADRYQGMKDVVVDLRAARRRLDTGPQTAAAPAVTRRIPVWGWAVAALVIAGIAAALILTRDRAPAPVAGTGKSAKPSVAVLYFDNTTGDQSIDWMRTGITEMVVTDLSQSRDIQVVGTDRLYAILADLKRQDDRVLSPEVIAAVAERTGVDRVVIGSYIKSGEAIRINVRLQDARTGRVESAERVEGANASALFSMVDDLSRRIRTKFETLGAEATLLTKPGAGGAPDLDRGLGDVTTSSIEAYRLYAEGIDLHERTRFAEAAAMFEKAIAVDASFAMAYAKLAVVEGNLGHFDRRDKYAARALSLSDRLTQRERFYIEGYSYTRSGSLTRAIEAYNKCLEIDPAHQACRHNVGILYMRAERQPEGIAHYEELIRRGSTNASGITNLLGGYIARGDTDKARALAESYLKRYPDNPRSHVNLSVVLVGEGRADEAIRELTLARQLGATDANTAFGLVLAQLLKEDWAGADATAKALLASADETARFFGAVAMYSASLLHGHSAEGLEWAKRVETAYKANGERKSVGHEIAAVTLLARGEAAKSVEAAALAVTVATFPDPEPTRGITLAMALSAAGRARESEAAIEAIARMGEPATAVMNRRDVAMARGLAALARGDSPAAVGPLQEAAAATPPRGGNVLGPARHVVLWSALGRALFESGKPAEALPWFRKAADSGFEHVPEPIDYVRSFYFLGRIYEQQGDTVKSREAYRRFAGYWKDGDLDRDRVAEATRKAGS